ncbi:MAG: hypothetical protein KGO92_08820 [Bacteroidota bacterium]|nr:hypothetical protein [Bacteroidota bacterium]
MKNKKCFSFLSLVMWSFTSFAQTKTLSFFDDFSESSQVQWASVKTGDPTYFKENGKYIIDFKNGERGWAVAHIVPNIVWDNLNIEISVTVVDGKSPGIGTGILLGNITTGGDSYRFVIQTDGSYAFGVFHKNQVKYLVPFTPAKEIVKGNGVENKLKVTVTKSKVYLYINYALVNTINLPEPLTGEQIALYSGKGQRAAFDNFRIDGFTIFADPPGDKLRIKVGPGYEQETVAPKKFATLNDFAGFLTNEVANGFPYANKMIDQVKLTYFLPVQIEDQETLGVKTVKVDHEFVDENIRPDKEYPFPRLLGEEFYFAFKAPEEANRFIQKLTNAVDQQNGNNRLVSMSRFQQDPDGKIYFALGNPETGMKEGAMVLITSQLNYQFMGEGWKNYTTLVEIRLNEPKFIRQSVAYYTAPKGKNTATFNSFFRRMLSVASENEYYRHINLKSLRNPNNKFTTPNNTQPAIFQIRGLDHPSMDLSEIEAYVTGLEGLLPDINDPQKSTIKSAFLKATVETFNGLKDSAEAASLFQKWRLKLSEALGNDYYTLEDEIPIGYKGWPIGKPKGESSIFFYPRQPGIKNHVELIMRKHTDTQGRLIYYDIYFLIV